MHGYESDLAYIHDPGFGDFARQAAPGLLDILRRAGIPSGLILNLGCGTAHPPGLRRSKHRHLLLDDRTGAEAGARGTLRQRIFSKCEAVALRRRDLDRRVPQLNLRRTEQATRAGAILSARVQRLTAGWRLLRFRHRRTRADFPLFRKAGIGRSCSKLNPTTMSWSAV
jgi:hypothetical protein